MIAGCQLLMKFIGLDEGYIGIEENKPDAIEHLDKLIASKGITNLKTFKLQARYPKGAERVLLYEITGKTMNAGELPAQHGVILSNVTTIAFVGQYFRTGMPLIQKRMTVDGDAVATPKNVMAPIGTQICDVIEFCGGYKEEPKKILMGGPDYLIQTGAYQPRLEKTFTPAPANRLDRNTTGLVIFGKNAPALQELNRMIRTKDMVRKLYLTIVCGKLQKPMRMRAKMTKNEQKNTVRVLAEDADEGKTMETIVRPLRSAQDQNRWFTLVEVEIITGRTHQIRAHLAQAGFPVIGDSKIGRASCRERV